MADESMDLVRALDQAREQVRQGSRLSQPARESLQKLLQELVAQGRPIEEHTSLGGQLQDAINRLEASRPDAVVAIEKVIDALGKMGL